MMDSTPTTIRGELPHTIRTVVEIAAPPDRVFEALTDPRELATWWGGDDARVQECEVDARPGGSWLVRTVDGDGVESTFGGEYLIVDPPDRLEQTWRGSDDSQPSIVRYDLEPFDIGGAEGTRLTVTHTEPLAGTAIQMLAAWFDAPYRGAWASCV